MRHVIFNIYAVCVAGGATVLLVLAFGTGSSSGLFKVAAVL
jgi:hypothetical protein